MLQTEEHIVPTSASAAGTTKTAKTTATSPRHECAFYVQALGFTGYLKEYVWSLFCFCNLPTHAQIFIDGDQPSVIACRTLN